MLEAFNLSGGINFSNLGDFMCYTLQYFAMIVAIYGVTLGVNALSKEEFKIEVIRDGKVEKTLENEKVDFSKLKDIFNKIEDERFI